MATVSFEQFMKQSGATKPTDVKSVGVNALPTTDAKPGYIKRVTDQYKEAGKSITEDFKKNTINNAPLTALHTVGNIAKATFAPVTAAISPVLEKGIDTLTDMPSSQKSAMEGPGSQVLKVADKIKEFGSKHPELARSAEDLYNIANVLAGAKGDVKLDNPLKVRPKVEGMLERAPETSAETPNNFVSRKLYETAIGRTTGEAERILTERANKLLGKEVTPTTTRATTAQKYGLAGRQTEIGVKAKALGEKLYQEKIAPAVKSSNRVVSKEELFKPVEEKIGEVTDPSRKIELQDALDAVKEDYNSVKDWTLEKAQKLKSEIDTFTPDKVFKGKPIASAYNEIRHDMADAIRKITYDSLADEGIKQKYLDYGNLKELEKLGIKGLTDNQLKGGAGSFISGIVQKIVTPIATYGGKALYKVPGTKINFIAPEGIGSLGEYLKSQGYDLPTSPKGEKVQLPQAQSIKSSSSDTTAIEPTQSIETPKIPVDNASEGFKKVGGIMEDDIGEIRDFQDLVNDQKSLGNISEKARADIEINARRIAEKLGINPDISNRRLATELSKKLEEIGQ